MAIDFKKLMENRGNPAPAAAPTIAKTSGQDKFIETNEALGLVYAKQWRENEAGVLAMVAKYSSIRDALSFAYWNLVAAKEIDRLEDLDPGFLMEVRAMAAEWIPVKVSRALTNAEETELHRRREKVACAVLLITHLLIKHNL